MVELLTSPVPAITLVVTAAPLLCPPASGEQPSVTPLELTSVAMAEPLLSPLVLVVLPLLVLVLVLVVLVVLSP